MGPLTALRSFYIRVGWKDISCLSWIRWRRALSKTSEQTRLQIDNNRFIQLARRAITEGWKVDRVNVEFSRMPVIEIPGHVEVDAARDLIGTRSIRNESGDYC